MARRVAYLKKAAGEPGHRLLVAGGDFFAPGSFDEKMKAQAGLKAFHMMHYDAVTVADFDFSQGIQTLLDAMQGLPLLTTNIVWSDTRKPLGETMIIKEYRGIPSENLPDEKFKVAVLSFLDERHQGPMDFYFEKEKRKLTVLPALQAAAEWVPRARKKADVVVALVHMNSTEALKFATDMPGIDVVVTGHTNEQIVDPPRRAGNTWVVANGDRGRFVAELRFNLDRNHRLSDPSPRQTPLDDRVGKDTLAENIVKEFKIDLDRVRGAGGAKGAPLKLETSPQWASFQVCVNCHQGITDAWSRTPHAKAYQTLVKEGNQGEQECLKCHVVGLGSPGGFNPARPDPLFQGVQCESCHGAGVKHSVARDSERKSTIIGHPDEQSCRRCHTAERSPNFNFAKYWEKIRH
ncbi:MAG: hypothetical protein HZB25_12215 [Candidatus Eisenbacteria bacterium]|nr:hypothetical protein [Candidatus Eisenbacteria bacterium]